MMRRIRVDSSQKKKNESGYLNIVKEQAREFCLSTGLHGYKYVGELHRSKTERVFWAVIIFISLVSAIATMILAYNYYASRPTITVIETTHHGIWNYPFPAVTVCNMNRVSFRLAQEFVGNLTLPPNLTTEYVLEELKLLILLLRPNLFHKDLRRNLTELQHIFDANDLSITTIVKSLAQNCSDLIKQCTWKSELVDCNLLFRPSLSRDGVCCSFNYITLKDGGPDSKTKRVTGCGYQSGLKITLNPEPEDYFAALRASFGAKIYLHVPVGYPDYNAENALIGLNTQTFMSVYPELTYTTVDTGSLAVPTRDCVYLDEGSSIDYPNIVKRNNTFVNYTYMNCMAECRVLIIREKCNCTPYYLPGNDVRICNLRDIECLNYYKGWYETSWPGVNMWNATERSRIDIRKRPCGCMPDCTLYRYPVQSSSGVLDRNVYYDDSDGHFTRIAENNTSLRNKSIVHIFFSDLVSTQYRRDLYYNWYSLFASFGGLLGLFSGFSLMSAFELIYFFIIRVITSKCRRKRRREN